MNTKSIRTGFIFGVILAVLYFILAPQAFGQNTDEALGEELKVILQKQVLPTDYDKLPYLSYASLKGALWAYNEMPKPTYIVPKTMLFSMTNSQKDGKWVTLYRVYFTPKPGASYDVPKNKIVRNLDVFETARSK
jgi:hypothetical protein